MLRSKGNVARRASKSSNIKSMATKFKQSLGAYGIIAGLSALLVVLGVLQFRWSNQIRTAELQRKQAALEAGMNGFREDFHRELAGICTSFTYRPLGRTETPATEDLYAQDCGEWARSSDHRELVANYYLWEKGKGKAIPSSSSTRRKTLFKQQLARRGWEVSATLPSSNPLSPRGAGIRDLRGCDGELKAPRWRWFGPSPSQAGAIEGVVADARRTARPRDS